MERGQARWIGREVAHLTVHLPSVFPDRVQGPLSAHSRALENSRPISGLCMLTSPSLAVKRIVLVAVLGHGGHLTQLMQQG